MVGLGETNEEIIEVMRDLRRHGVTMLTLVSICSCCYHFRYSVMLPGRV